VLLKKYKGARARSQEKVIFRNGERKRKQKKSQEKTGKLRLQKKRSAPKKGGGRSDQESCAGISAKRNREKNFRNWTRIKPEEKIS